MAKQIIYKPVVSEKSEKMTSKSNKYTFIVNKDANKIEIKKAIEEMFSTNVVAVNTAVMPSTPKARNTKSGVVRGRISAFKKAYITLAEGEEIEIFGAIEE
ncbi:MAG: 50S ribosomal protein L23 [Saprospiraceae bacterium]|nr:50S ribosomal protein L23 [Saprospiraceae bacterium]MCB9310602.1 50S ribosomal protein L23 [Lewinellaceae bacterium]